MQNQGTENPYESISMKVGRDALPVCPNCFEPCDPKAHYCPKCGSNDPINPMASYMPLESVRFQAGFYGKLWRKTWAPDTRAIDRAINIMLLILFCPFIILIGLPVAIFEKCKSQKNSSVKQQGK